MKIERVWSGTVPCILSYSARKFSIRLERHHAKAQVARKHSTLLQEKVPMYWHRLAMKLGQELEDS